MFLYQTRNQFYHKEMDKAKQSVSLQNTCMIFVTEQNLIIRLHHLLVKPLVYSLNILITGITISAATAAH